MKTLLTFSLIALSLLTRAQGLAGRWQGQMGGQGGSLPSTLTLRASGNALSGTLVFTQNGASETHHMTGEQNGNAATGTVKLNGQPGFVFEMQLTGGQLGVVIGYNGQAVLQGQYTRGNGNQAARPATVQKQQQASGLAKEWIGLIGGRRLLYLYTGNGMADKWYYDLCSNGTYSYGSDNSYSSEGFSAVTADGATGTWQVQTEDNMAYLVLTPRGESPTVRFISFRAQGEVNLGGKRYFLTKNQSCQ